MENAFPVFSFLLLLLFQFSYEAPSDISHRGDEKLELVYTSWDPSEEAKKDLSPIILLHGMTADRTTWLKLAARFAEATGRKVYAMDARNHGDSPRSNTINFEVLAEDLDEFMKGHDIPKAVIVGHSMGGRTAITFALKKGEKVEKFVSEDIGTTNISPEHIAQLIKQMVAIEKVLSFVPASVDEMTAKKIVYEFMIKELPQDAKEETKEPDYSSIAIKKENGRFVWKANLEVIKQSLRDHHLDQKLQGEYPGNALFLYGTKSSFHVDKDESNIKQLFPKARLVSVEGAGHRIHELQPELFFDTVTKFING